MSAPASADANLVNLVLALLTPMFLWSTDGDIRLARAAAAETLNAYRVANRLSLFTVAKIIAFDIATLSSLSQSMYEDVSIPLSLRLRGNANSLDRSGERNRHALEQASRTEAAEDSVEAAIAEAQRMVHEATARIDAAATAAEARPEPEPAAAPVSAARMSAQAQRSAWADAMTAVAKEFAAGLDDLPSGERRQEMARIEALTTAAADLAAGTAVLPVRATAAARAAAPGTA